TEKMLLILTFLSIIGLGDAKVDFTYSMLLDEYDLNGVTDIPLERCTDGGCLIFVSASDKAMAATKNIFVHDQNNQNNFSLYTYASGYDNTGKMKALPLAGTGYSIQNLNTGNIGPIAIYHVSSTAPLYNTNYIELFDGLRMNRADKASDYVSILSPDPYDIYVQSLDNYLSVFVRATGFDNNAQSDISPDNCLKILDQNTLDRFRLHINSPIITIAFQGQVRTQICVKPQPNNAALLDYSGIATSQGYVGCLNNKWQRFRSSAYTSPDFEIHDSSYVDRSITLDYSVHTNSDDKVTFTMTQIAGGTNSFQVYGDNVMVTRTYTATKINIAMANNYGSSYLVKYFGPGGLTPTGEGICANYVPQTTTSGVSSTTTIATTTTSGATDLSALLCVIASILIA
ncbi:hypothetical protein PRIPAC_86760, partial [Pristionchus pacificus]